MAEEKVKLEKVKNLDHETEQRLLKYVCIFETSGNGDKCPKLLLGPLPLYPHSAYMFIETHKIHKCEYDESGARHWSPIADKISVNDLAIELVKDFPNVIAITVNEKDKSPLNANTIFNEANSET